MPPQIDNKMGEAVLKSALNLYCRPAVNNLGWLEYLPVLRNTAAIQAIVLNVVQTIECRLKY
jgi:hypothetical protein